MKLILHIFITLLLTGGFFSCKTESGPEPQPKSNRPNVILILTDDQGWGDLSLHGNTNLSTPNIDAIAKDGVSFENFYVQPVCSPTRAELLTGRYFPRLGVYSTSAGGERFNSGETTVAEVFKSAGYHTAAYGKWHNGTQPPYHPNARGFDDFYGFASGHWGNYFSPILEHNGKIVQGKGFIVEDLTNKGLEFIARYRDEPFLLYLPFNTPHSPMQVPDNYWDRVKDRKLQMTYQGEEEENPNFTKAAMAMVENIDHNVGRITQKLKELGLEENTILIFLSDNGPNGWRWNGGMRGRKGSTDEGGVRSPFFMLWKDSLPAGKKINEIASTLDILPTLANLCNIKMETTNIPDGKDLTPLLFGEDRAWEDRLVYNHWNGKTSIRSQEYRLDHENRLYDITSDRGQTTDISKQKPAILDSLKRAKTKWLKEVVPDSIDKEARLFPIGHPDFVYTHLPARDGRAHGNIERSNRYPNDSFFTNWISVRDSITWDVEVLSEGDYEVDLYYTCAAKNTDATIELSLGGSKILKKITEAHDPPLRGMENDRDPRIESYVKDFRPIMLGAMTLKKGNGPLSLKATEIPGKGVVDVRLLVFKKQGN